MKWINMLTLLKQIGKKFKMLIVKMAIDFGSMEATKSNVLNLCGIDTIMGLPCIFPMLESINVLMKFVKGKDYLYVITLQLSKFAKQTYIGCMVIQNTSFQATNIDVH